MMTIEYFLNLKRMTKDGYKYITTSKHYIQHSTIDLCIKDIKEILRTYGDEVINMVCTLMPFNKNSPNY